MIRLAIALWIIATIVVGIRSFLTPQRNSVYTIYASAAQRWLRAEPLGIIAPGQGDPYRYGPPFIPLILPFAVLPEYLGGVLWRVACTGCLLTACGWLFAALTPSPSGPGIRYSIFLIPYSLFVFSTRNSEYGMRNSEFGTGVRATGWLWLILLPLSLGNINNGQANVLLAALIAATAAAVLEQRWTIASLCTALCCVIKLYPLVLAAVLIVLFPRRFAVRFLAAIAGLLLLPYVLQSSDYVTHEYAEWMQSFADIDCRREALVTPSPRGESAAVSGARRDLRLVLWLIDAKLANAATTAMSLALAGLVALACRTSGSCTRDRVLTILFLCTCWMLLCGPATESATYILLAPLLLWRLSDVYSRPATPLTRVVVLTSVTGLIVYNAACWFPGGRSFIYALQPIATLALFIDCEWEFRRAVLRRPRRASLRYPACVPGR